MQIIVTLSIMKCSNEGEVGMGDGSDEQAISKLTMTDMFILFEIECQPSKTISLS